MRKKHFINIMIIILLLAVLFLSQHPLFEERGREVYSRTSEFINKIKLFFNQQILSRIIGEVEQRKENVSEGLEFQTQATLQGAGDIFQRIKNFFISTIKSAIN